jgi:hypothetical protein
LAVLLTWRPHAHREGAHGGHVSEPPIARRTEITRG